MITVRYEAAELGVSTHLRSEIPVNLRWVRGWVPDGAAAEAVQAAFRRMLEPDEDLGRAPVVTVSVGQRRELCWLLDVTIERRWDGRGWDFHVRTKELSPENATI